MRGNTIIDYQHPQNAGLGEQLEAIADLARLCELINEGMASGELEGDELLHSLIWPLRTIAGSALEKHRKQGARKAVA